MQLREWVSEVTWKSLWFFWFAVATPQRQPFASRMDWLLYSSVWRNWNTEPVVRLNKNQNQQTTECVAMEENNNTNNGKFNVCKVGCVYVEQTLRQHVYRWN